MPEGCYRLCVLLFIACVKYSVLLISDVVVIVKHEALV